jgi:putative nucleotidyltransferase with HDIG domain
MPRAITRGERSRPNLYRERAGLRVRRARRPARDAITSTWRARAPKHRDFTKEFGVQGNDILDQLRQLPAQPTAMSLLLAELENPESDARSITNVLQADPSLTARVLHLSNAPYFGLAGRVTSLERAVVALGASTLRSLAVSSATGMLTDDASAMPEGFWSHSVAVAAASAVVARECRFSPGDALCAGLLHDVGSALIFRFDRESWEKRLHAGISGDALLEEEQTVYGGDHAMIGAFALDQWHLPAELSDAVRSHHDPGASGSNKTAQVVIAGEALVHATSETVPFDFEPAAESPYAALATVGINLDCADELVERATDEGIALEQILSVA